MANDRHSGQSKRTSPDSSTKDPIVDFVVKEFMRYEEYHGDRFRTAKQIYDHWKSKPPRRDWDWQNAVHVPMTFEAEQTITPRLFAALFPDEAPLDIKVYEGGEDKELQAIAIKNLIKHHFRLSDVQGESWGALSQCTLLGTGYLEDTWLTRRKWQVNPSNSERYLALTDNRPSCNHVSFFELFPHPAKIKMDDGLPLIRRRFADAEFIKRLADSPQFKSSNLKEALESDSTVSESTTGANSPSPNHDKNLKKREEYEILEYWGPWDESYKKDDLVVTRNAVPYWIIVINRKIKLRAIPNPYNHQQPPFSKVVLFPDPHPCWFGVGVGQVGKPTQERLNKIVNQRLDNVDLVLNKQGFYNGNDTLINTKKLQVSKPGQWHKVSDTVGSIRWMDMPDVTSSSYREEELAKADFRESTGATIPLQPTDQGQHRTATGINLLQGAAGARFRPVIRQMETDLIQRLAFHFLSNLQQFMIAPEWVDATSEDGQHEPVLVRPEMIQSKVMFLPTGLSEMLTKEVQIGQLLRFKEVTAQDPTVNRAEINKRIAQLMGFKELNKLIVPQQPAQQGPGELPPEAQERIRQRLAEGASPDQIKLELLGQPPAPEEGGIPEEALL
jgi:hypothetical protein